MKMTGIADQGGQEFPITQTVTKDGKMAIVINFQGQNITFQAFDGEQMWVTNFQSMKAQALDAETSANYKQEAKDVVDTFLNYKDKGYTIKLDGEETIEGTETYKLIVTKKPVMDGDKEVPSVTTFYFDKEKFVPVVSETTTTTGLLKGMTVKTLYSDYLKAGSIYYPHNVTIKRSGQLSQSIKIESIDINSDIDQSIFKMPTE